MRCCGTFKIPGQAKRTGKKIYLCTVCGEAIHVMENGHKQIFWRGNKRDRVFRKAMPKL